MAGRFLGAFFGSSLRRRRADHTGRRGKVLRDDLGFVSPKHSLLLPRVRSAKILLAVSVLGRHRPRKRAIQ
jgi:hypothetical protein